MSPLAVSRIVPTTMIGIVDPKRLFESATRGIERCVFPATVQEPVLLAEAVDVVADHIARVVDRLRDGASHLVGIVNGRVGGGRGAVVNEAVLISVVAEVIPGDLSEIVDAGREGSG